MQKLGCPQLATFDNSMSLSVPFPRNYANVVHSSLQPIPWREIESERQVPAMG
jgi:hypothetical protein